MELILFYTLTQVLDKKFHPKKPRLGPFVEKKNPIHIDVKTKSQIPNLNLISSNALPMCQPQCPAIYPKQLQKRTQYRNKNVDHNKTVYNQRKSNPKTLF